MTKEVFESFIAVAEAQGITNYAIRCEGGNRIIYHNDTTEKLIFKDDEVIHVGLSRNYASEGQSFVISVITYDCIDSVLLNEVPFADAIDIVKSLDAFDAEMEAFFAQAPNKRDLKPGTAGLAVRTDKDGKPIIAPGSNGYVTK